MFFDLQTILMLQKSKFTDYFLCKMQSNGKYRVHLGLCIVAMETKFLLGVQELIKSKLLQHQLARTGTNPS